MTDKGLKHLLNEMSGINTKYMTVKEFRDWLNEIIDEGHGDKELWFGYDGNYAYTAYNKRIYEVDGNDVVIKENDV